MSDSQILTTCDGYNISAIHTVSKKQKVVLWLHGITVDKNEYLNFFKDGADYLSMNGIDSLRIDFRGHGESEGTSKEFSIIGQNIDTKAAIKFITDYYSGANIEVYILGCSFGAPPAIYAAIEYPKIIKKLLLISPVLSYKRTFLNPETEWAQELFNPETISLLEKTDELFLNEHFPIGMRLIEEMKIIRPETDINLTTQETIIIHGDADSMVPFDVSEKISKTSNKITLYPIKGMDHGFTDKLDEEGIGTKSLENKNYIYDLLVDQCS
jgi:pimeloyl-ACP methyl ester carboxylesterase